MWILTGVLLGSIVTSTHDNEEACRGRKAMLEQVKGVTQVECRAANNIVYGGSGILNCVNCGKTIVPLSR